MLNNNLPYFMTWFSLVLMPKTMFFCWRFVAAVLRRAPMKCGGIGWDSCSCTRTSREEEEESASKQVFPSIMTLSYTKPRRKANMQEKCFLMLPDCIVTWGTYCKCDYRVQKSTVFTAMSLIRHSFQGLFYCSLLWSSVVVCFRGEF